MNNSFSTIKEFISSKEICVFCGRKLKCLLISFGMGPHNLPVIEASSIDNRFNFQFNHTTSSWQISSQCVIDINSGITTLELTEASIPDMDPKLDFEATNYLVAKHALEGFFPHIELYCSSKKCKMKYILHSDTFKFDKFADEIRIFKIRPFKTYMESFEIDKWWIQNDWINNSLNIYSKNHMDADPVKHSTLNLSEMDREKVITRIRTLVTFS